MSFGLRGYYKIVSFYIYSVKKKVNVLALKE